MRCCQTSTEDLFLFLGVISEAPTLWEDLPIVATKLLIVFFFNLVGDDRIYYPVGRPSRCCEVGT